ncbi:hypothetical protein ACLKA7_016290 [Drosophila subpalustris]
MSLQVIELPGGTTESHTGPQATDAGTKMSSRWNPDAVLDHKVIGCHQFPGYHRPVVYVGAIQSAAQTVAPSDVDRVDEGTGIAAFLVVAATRAALTHEPH